MVLLQLTEPLLARINELKLPTELANLVAAQLSPSSDEAARSTASTSTAQEQRTISHEVLVKISSWSKTKKGKNPCTLASLLRLTDIHAPPLAPRVRSPELIAILDSIQLAQDKASYASMTSLAGPQFQSVLPLNDKYEPPFSNGPTKTDAEEWKEIRQQVGAIVNVGASMMAVGTGVWWVGGGRSYAARLVLALSGALAIALIESFLYVRFFAQRKEKAKGPKRGKVLKIDRRPPGTGGKQQKALKSE